MGRGRAKAKQTKVARDLKYNTGHTDLGKLQAELAGAGAVPAEDSDEFEGEEYADDRYAQYYDDMDEESDVSSDSDED